MLDAGTISAIIGGSTNLVSSFLGFGADIYAIQNQETPNNVENITITIPDAPKQQQNNTLLYVGIGIGVFVLVLAIVFIILKSK